MTRIELTYKNMPSGLGRGLGSLIPKKTNYLDLDATSDGSLQVKDAKAILSVDPNSIKINPYQPRRDFSPLAVADLAASIKEYGMIQPLIVTRSGDGYELIAGERRLRASKSIGLKEVPVIVREADKQRKLELALIENLQREDLNLIETAIAYNQLMGEFNLTQDEIGLRVSKPRSTISNTLRLLNLPEEIKEALIAKKITWGHAKYLLGLDSEAKQLSVFRQIILNNLSLADTDKKIKSLGGTKAAKVKMDFNDQARAENLQRWFGFKTELKRMSNGGRIIVSFGSDEELGEIMRKISV